MDDGLPYIMPNKEVLTEEVWPTILKDVIDNTYLSIRKDASGNMIVSTKSLATGKNLSASVKTASLTRWSKNPTIQHSNYFGSKAVFHEINDYFVYTKPQ